MPLPDPIPLKIQSPISCYDEISGLNRDFRVNETAAGATSL